MNTPNWGNSFISASWNVKFLRPRLTKTHSTVDVRLTNVWVGLSLFDLEFVLLGFGQWRRRLVHFQEFFEAFQA